MNVLEIHQEFFVFTTEIERNHPDLYRPIKVQCEGNNMVIKIVNSL